MKNPKLLTEIKIQSEYLLALYDALANEASSSDEAAKIYEIRGKIKSASSTAIEQAENAKGITCPKFITPVCKMQEQTAARALETAGACADPSDLLPVDWVAALRFMLEENIICKLTGLLVKPIYCNAMSGNATLDAIVGNRKFRLELRENCLVYEEGDDA